MAFCIIVHGLYYYYYYYHYYYRGSRDRHHQWQILQVL